MPTCYDEQRNRGRRQTEIVSEGKGEGRSLCFLWWEECRSGRDCSNEPKKKEKEKKRKEKQEREISALFVAGGCCLCVRSESWYILLPTPTALSSAAGCTMIGVQYLHLTLPCRDAPKSQFMPVGIVSTGESNTFPAPSWPFDSETTGSWPSTFVVGASSHDLRGRAGAYFHRFRPDER